MGFKRTVDRQINVKNKKTFLTFIYQNACEALREFYVCFSYRYFCFSTFFNHNITLKFCMGLYTGTKKRDSKVAKESKDQANIETNIV
jgi:hypothetical protein